MYLFDPISKELNHLSPIECNIYPSNNFIIQSVKVKILHIPLKFIAISRTFCVYIPIAKVKFSGYEKRLIDFKP